MMYKAENEELNSLDFHFASVISAECAGNDLMLTLCDCEAEWYAVGNESKKKCTVPRIRLRLEDFSIKKALFHEIPYLSPKDNTIKKTREKAVYKSEIDLLVKRLCEDDDIDIFSLRTDESEKGVSVKTEINFAGIERAWYRIEFACKKITAEWESFGEPVSDKLTLKMRAALMKSYIPAVFLALGHKDTPRTAKIAAAAAMGYALSPIDLIPDFIPVLGYIDDVIILSGLIGIAVKLIPNDVFTECYRKAAAESVSPKKKWFYSLPVIIIWIIIMGLIAKAVLI